MDDLNKFIEQNEEWFKNIMETIRDYASKLRASEKWFSTTLKSIGDAVIATDELGNIQFMNEVAEDLTGWSESTAMG